MSAHYLSCPASCALEHQPRERPVRCVGVHPRRSSAPWTCDLDGLCDDCRAEKERIDEERAAMHEEARERAAEAAYADYAWERDL